MALSNQQPCNYYINNDMFTRTDRDLKEISQFCSNTQNTNYGPNPVPSQRQNITSIGAYKSLGNAYEASIKNDCLNRWDNDYDSWSKKMNKSTN